MAKMVNCACISCKHHDFVEGCVLDRIDLAYAPRYNSAGELENTLLCKQYEEGEEYKQLKSMMYKTLGIDI